MSKRERRRLMLLYHSKIRGARKKYPQKYTNLQQSYRTFRDEIRRTPSLKAFLKYLEDQNEVVLLDAIPKEMQGGLKAWYADMRPWDSYKRGERAETYAVGWGELQKNRYDPSFYETFDTGDIIPVIGKIGGFTKTGVKKESYKDIFELLRISYLGKVTITSLVGVVSRPYKALRLITNVKKTYRQTGKGRVVSRDKSAREVARERRASRRRNRR